MKKQILWLVFCSLMGMLTTSCDPNEAIEPPCTRVEPTFQGESTACDDCTIDEVVDRLGIVVEIGESTKRNFSDTIKSSTYDDIGESSVSISKDSTIILSVVGGGDNSEKLKLSVRSFEYINGGLSELDNHEKELSVPNFNTNYCQLNFKYDVNETNLGDFDEALIKVEIDNGNPQIIRMKIRIKRF